MKESVKDKATLSGIRPRDVASYLRATGWVQAEAGSRSAIWSLDQAKARLLLPMDPTVADYPARMADLLDMLSRVVGRDRSDLLADFTDVTTDAYRVRWVGDDSAPGRIPLDAGVHLLESTRAMLLAAAASTLSSRTFHPPGRPQRQVEEYLQHVRLAAPEQGSYVVVVRSPVVPELRTEEQLALWESNVPFGRRVMVTLTKALSALHELTDDAASKGTVAAEDAASRGVSANLCDAVADTFERGASRIEAAVSWSPLRPQVSEAPVLFERDMAVWIRQIGEVLRSKAVIEGAAILGVVVSLNRRPKAQKGSVTMLAFLDEKPSYVRITDVAEADYKTFSNAHRDRQPIRCEGDLSQEGNTHLLRNVRSIKIE